MEVREPAFDPKCDTLCLHRLHPLGFWVIKFPYWTRSGFEIEGLSKFLKDLFGQAHTAFRNLMSSS